MVAELLRRVSDTTELQPGRSSTSSKVTGMGGCRPPESARYVNQEDCSESANTAVDVEFWLTIPQYKRADCQ